MCRQVCRYDCGHTRNRHKVECNRYGKVSTFVRRVLYDQVCERTIVQRRHRLCRACDPDCDDNEPRRDHRQDHHRDHHRKNKKHKKSGRDPRSREDREDRGRRRDRSSHGHSHRAKSTRAGGSWPEQRPESPRRRETSEPADYAAWRGDWEASLSNDPEAWLSGLPTGRPGDDSWDPELESECEQRVSDTGARSQQDKPAPGIPESAPPGGATVQQQSWGFPESTTPPQASRPPSSQYTPARTNWDKLPHLPNKAYRPSTPPRPPSSVYPSVVGFPQPRPPPPQTRNSSSSAANSDDFITVYADTDVATDVLSRPEFPSQGEHAVGGWGRPRPPPPGQSRYAGLPATKSEFMAQGAAPNRHHRHHPESKPLPPSPHPRRSAAKRPAHQVRDPSGQASTNESRDRHDDERPSIGRSVTAPAKQPGMVWHPALQRWTPEPTPSTVGSQAYQHPRPAPRPPAAPRPARPRQSSDQETTVSLFYPHPEQGTRHHANQRPVEQNHSRTSSSRGSGSGSGKQTGPRSSRPSTGSSGSKEASSRPLNQVGKGLMAMFHLRKQPSEASFVCVDAARYEAQFRPQTSPPSVRRKPQGGRRG
ncbi:hypothetical protein ACO1O0_000383 [Amphichorda felina]